ncbi:unnamed protein product [Mytilus coruscus]|uniref:CCHC-type domain-containing protein n=1 Tax=Mytilus coruscus TaxID=42192 RepID=A0A6J8AQM1_MYTCO|nr:unnamed protein product [Mytilus coruscus]
MDPMDIESNVKRIFREEIQKSQNEFLSKLDGIFTSRLQAFGNQQKERSEAQMCKLQTDILTADTYKFQKKSCENQFKFNKKMNATLKEAESCLDPSDDKSAHTKQRISEADNGNNSGGAKSARRPGVCYNCYKPGHWQFECPEKNKKLSTYSNLLLYNDAYRNSNSLRDFIDESLTLKTTHLNEAHLLDSGNDSICLLNREKCVDQLSRHLNTPSKLISPVGKLRSSIHKWKHYKSEVSSTKTHYIRRVSHLLRCHSEV